MKYLQDLFEKVLGKDEVILFTVNPAVDYVMQCGTIPTLFNTVDFGPGKCYEEIILKSLIFVYCTNNLIAILTLLFFFSIHLQLSLAMFAFDIHNHYRYFVLAKTEPGWSF